MTEEEQKTIKLLLGIAQDTNNKSCIQLAIKSARLHTNRNLNTGVLNETKGSNSTIHSSSKYYEDVGDKYIPAEESEYDDIICQCIGEADLFLPDIFTGLLIYLIILEQIGYLFKKVNPEDKKYGIDGALKNFSTIKNNTYEAIRQLRNSLAHNFSLANNPKRGQKYYKFELLFDNAGKNQSVELPVKAWGGDYSDKSEETSTKIHVQALCDEIENVIKNVKKEYDKRNLALRPELKIDEIKTRFTIKT